MVYTESFHLLLHTGPAIGSNVLLCAQTMLPSLARTWLTTIQVKKIADQLEESERSATTENWGLFLARKEAAFRGQQQVGY